MKPNLFVGRAVVTATLTGAALLLTAGPAAAGSVIEGPVTGDPGAWAAIAISPRTGNVGYTFDHPTRSSAERGAVSRCRASDCQTVVVVANGCAAVAQASNRSWGWAYAGSPSSAQSRAVSAAPGGRARVIKWVCTRGHQ
ncbi:MAG TPA: DUF4189 domain-containing protein [Pseudonocardia sp.]|uniref:DUF4189 domain-containing protein n=1 Tax=Pseudonocardia sp. TaxID=60912 RepID=UPI002C379A81|nr:DUF4189 domain-containing protein [Pseudonocardia sp.]HTF49901.1 DUF4189 domain-containing protein [Pseudonocardia sp.]